MKMTNFVPRFYSAVLLSVSIACLTFSGMAIDNSFKTGVLLHGKIGGSSSGSKPNFVFSPLSIFSVFHAAQKGAIEETRSQMDILVGPDEKFVLPSTEGEERKLYEVDIANKIFVDDSLTDVPQFVKFKNELAEEGALAGNLDFKNPSEAASHINGFVAEVTKDHIKQLVEESDVRGCKMVLVNALYFKGSWHNQFNRSATYQGTFHAPAGPTEVSYMTGDLGEMPAIYYSEDGLVTVGVPYKDRHLRMYIFMPSDINEFESRIISDPILLEAIVSNMEQNEGMSGWKQRILLTMPKFKLSAEDNKVDLVDLFKDLGAKDMFSSEEANFSNITGSKDLFVSSYMHQADIIVDEEGTEATAATTMGFMMRSAGFRKEQIDVLIDKPFIFQIRFVPDTGKPLVLFSGRIADPSSAQ